MNNDLKEILEQIRLHSQTGNRHELAHALRALMAKRREYYLQCVEEGRIEEFADALYKTLLLELDGSSGVFLPEVPIEQGWNKQMYLENLCLKAGIPSKSWRNERAHLYWYETFSFDVPREDAPKPAPEPTQAPNGAPGDGLPR